jgi:hypothetical protein
MNFIFFSSRRLALPVLAVLLLLTAKRSSGQTSDSGSALQGIVKDSSGAVIPGATITLTDGNGGTHATRTRGDGRFLIKDLPPATYAVKAEFTGFEQSQAVLVTLSVNKTATANISMTVASQKQEVTITESSTNQISTEAANNASALVLRQEDLDALPDDPDDLKSDLEALAGPSAGPGGNQIFIDGFTGGRLPPKSSIREIRINSNPFSSEYDKLGFGRIEIFTKPGTDKFHGQGYFGTSEDIWNSRNPFLTTKPPFETQLFGGNISGPLGSRASFFIDVDRRNINDNGIVNATIPTADFLNTQLLQSYFPTPQRRTTVSPRIDYRLSSNNTLSLRYAYLANDQLMTGIGQFNVPELTLRNAILPSNGYTQSANEHLVQLVDTAVLNPRVINETHFQLRAMQSTIRA